MDATDFEQIIKETLAQAAHLLIEKGKEYRRNNNPLHNFEVGAAMTGQTREEVLQGFLLKHLISARDLRDDIKKGVLPLEKTIEEKYNDIILYFLIEKASMLDHVRKVFNRAVPCD